MQGNDRKFLRGYRSSLTSARMQEFRSKFVETSLFKAIIRSFFTLLSVYLLSYFNFYFFTKNFSIFYILITLIIFIFNFNRHRALENIIHFGSHCNFTRGKGLNDVLVDVSVAFPMVFDVGRYRQFHAKHHANFGGAADPCRLRFEKINLPTVNIALCS